MGFGDDGLSFMELSKALSPLTRSSMTGATTTKLDCGVTGYSKTSSPVGS